MFIEFQVGNYRSFRNIEKFTMLAAPKRANDGSLEENNVFEKEGLRFLKTKAIYGANASGKSNLISAFHTFCSMIVMSVKEEKMSNVLWNQRYKLTTDWDDQPMFFQYTFLLNEEVFRYGFQISNGNISFEWLMGSKNNDKEVEYFMREDNFVTPNKEYFGGYEKFLASALDGKNELLRSDSLFLTSAALNGNSLAFTVRNKIFTTPVIDGINDEGQTKLALDYLNSDNEPMKKAIKSLLKSSDTGIEDLELIDEVQNNHNIENDKSNSYKVLLSTHTRFDLNGNIVDKVSHPFKHWESEGTKKMLGIGAIILLILKRGGIILIDEFDARLHPNLTLKIVNTFNSLKTNPKNAQLIFVSHDTGLLRRANLRRDQITLINKNKFGSSTIQTLIDYKGVRKDSSFEKEYLDGTYNAIPFLNNIDNDILNFIEEDEA